MMKNLSMGISIGLLKQKLLVRNCIEPAANNVVHYANLNKLGKASSNVVEGFNASPTNMSHILAEKLSELSRGEKIEFFANLTTKSHKFKKSVLKTLQQIQPRIDQEVGKSKQYIDYNMKKLFVMASQNGVDMRPFFK